MHRLTARRVATGLAPQLATDTTAINRLSAARLSPPRPRALGNILVRTRHQNQKRKRRKEPNETTKQRCFNPKNANFKYYGGRASGPIQGCAQWSDFRLFWRDMEATWFPGASIDRLDNDGHYNRLNCMWSAPKESANNRRNEPQKGEKNGS